MTDIPFLILTPPPGYGVQIVKEPRSSLSTFSSLSEFIDTIADDFPVQSMFDIVRAKTHIARDTRRGTGNHIAGNFAGLEPGSKQEEIIMDFFKMDNNIATVQDASLTGFYVFYKSIQHEFDGAWYKEAGVIAKTPTYYLNPHAKGYVKKLVF